MPWEETQDYVRSGHRDPSEFEPDSLRTIWISEEEGVKAVIGKPKGETTTEVVSYLFMKKKDWTLEKAKAWFQEHQSETRHEHLYCLTPILEKIMEKPLKIWGVALMAGMSRNLNIYMAEELKSLAPKLVGPPVYLEHVSALDAVGRVTDAVWDPASKALFYEAEIYDDATQEKIQKEGQVVTLERRLNHARAVLSKLEQQPLRWTPLLKATIQVCGSPPRLYYILKYLEKEGFVKHITIKDKAHWAITEKGKQFPQILSKNTDEQPRKEELSRSHRIT